MTIRFAAYAPGGRTLNALHCGVNDASLIRVHGLQRGPPAGLRSLISDALRQFLQGFFSFFPVVPNIDGYAIIAVVNPVGHQTGQIL